MKNLTWPNNVCNEDTTSIHAWFTREDIDFLFSLVPGGFLTPTFCSDLPLCALSQRQLHYLDEKLSWSGPYGKEKSFYFSFLFSEGERLINFIKKEYPDVKMCPKWWERRD